MISGGHGFQKLGFGLWVSETSLIGPGFFLSMLGQIFAYISKSSRTFGG